MNMLYKSPMKWLAQPTESTSPIRAATRRRALLFSIIMRSVLPLTSLPVLGSDQASMAPARTFRVDDLLTIEALAQSVLSPDGKVLAIAVGTPSERRAAKMNGIWIQGGRDTAPEKIPGTGSPELSWTILGWSPRGGTLALGAYDGRVRHLYLFSMASQRLARIAIEEWCQKIEWLNEDELVCDAVVRFPSPGMREIAPQAWRDHIEGKTPTVSVLESGVTTQPRSDRRRLFRVDARDASVTVVIQGDYEAWVPAPDGRSVAFYRCIQRLEIYPQAGKPMNRVTLPGNATPTGAVPEQKFQFEIIGIDGAVKRVLPTAVHAYAGQVISWSPDSSMVVFGDGEAKAVGETRLAQISVANASSDCVDLKFVALAEDRPLWVANHKFVARGRFDDAAHELSTPRWCTVDAFNPVGDSKDAMVTGRLFGYDGSSCLLIQDNALWTVALGEEGLASPQGVPSAGKVSGVKLIPDNGPGTAASAFYVLEREDGGVGLLERASLRFSPLTSPAPQALLASYAQTTGEVVWMVRRGEDGSRAWRCAAGKPPALVLVANAFMAAVREGERKTFEYSNQRGEKLIGVMLLPPNYEAGRRYPVLTVVYLGAMRSNLPQEDSTRWDPAWYNPQIPASAGYIVLFPSMPTPPFEQTYEPYSLLDEGVSPAIDHLVSQGIADPERLFLFGHSFGGYSTFGLVTRTHRFKAAIASAGISDLTSAYGTLVIPYSEETNLQVHYGMGLIEYNQGGMGVPPWEDPARYARNSPISFVNRVTTPILIVHGDLDRAVPIQQSDEFYRSLFRQGKRASYARYWGEDHGFTSPANLRDFWSRVFSWCDEFGDIARDQHGRPLWDGSAIRSRAGDAPLPPQAFLGLDALFDPAFGLPAPL